MTKYGTYWYNFVHRLTSPAFPHLKYSLPYRTVNNGRLGRWLPPFPVSPLMFYIACSITNNIKTRAAARRLGMRVGAAKLPSTLVPALASLSTRLSTAMLEGAQASTCEGRTEKGRNRNLLKISSSRKH